MVCCITLNNTKSNYHIFRTLPACYIIYNSLLHYDKHQESDYLIDPTTSTRAINCPNYILYLETPTKSNSFPLRSLCSVLYPFIKSYTGCFPFSSSLFTSRGQTKTELNPEAFDEVWKDLKLLPCMRYTTVLKSGAVKELLQSSVMFIFRSSCRVCAALMFWLPGGRQSCCFCCGIYNSFLIFVDDWSVAMDLGKMSCLHMPGLHRPWSAALTSVLSPISTSAPVAMNSFASFFLL